MLPSRRYNGQYGLTDFFNDFFENKTLERAEFTTPAINVAENSLLLEHARTTSKYTSTGMETS